MSKHAVREQARQVLNAYLTAELGHALLLDDADLIAKQRGNFLREFGPERLAAVSGSELLRLLPYNLTNPPSMDYWLEFRHDETFSCALFGGISGGSAAKFGTWQDKRTGHWRAKVPNSLAIRDIGEAEALRIVEERRQEMLATVEVLSRFSERPIGEVDPEAVQAAVATAAPHWKASAWLHKYLHLNFPELVTWRATSAYLQSDLYHLGVVATGSGLYAYDIKLIQFWDSLPALAQVAIPLRYRLSKGLVPHDHWGFIAAGEAPPGEAMLAGGYLALGPAPLESLAGVFSLTRSKEVREGIEMACQEAGVAADPECRRDLLNLGYALKEGSIVALLSDATTVIAVGEVSGSYRYSVGEQWPHQVPVRWLHQDSFALSPAVERGSANLVFLEPHRPAVADLEASLRLNGMGPWPGFAQVVGSDVGSQAILEPGPNRIAEPAATPLEPLEPPEGTIRDIMAMLAHKPQVILYGPPGTGKTYYAERTALELVARHNLRRLPAQLAQRQRDRIYGRDGTDPYIVTCTFHPHFAYEDFIEGYRPSGKGFSLQPGIFRRMAAAARVRPQQRFVLIIDEINRGNIPSIFGELITLLEPGQRGSAYTLLPLSGEPFTVPANLYLIGTMNTADRSILLLDTALRRRFAFKELLPDPERLKTARIGAIPLSTWLRALNRRIKEQLGRDGRNLQVGHAYFMIDGRPAVSLRRIAAIVRDELWPLLQEYCYEDPQTLAAILGADKGGIYDRETAELRYRLFEPGREDALITALAAILAPEDIEATAEEDDTRAPGRAER